MSLISIVQAVADEVGLPRPAAVANSTDQLARQMFALANTVLEEVCRLDWPVLNIDYTFPTVVGQESYALPNDFGRLIGDSAYLASQYYSMRGSLSAPDWMRQKNALPSMLGRYKLRIYGNPLKIYIQPLPGTVENIALEYVSSNRAYDAGSVKIAAYAADTDTSIVPEHVVAKGLKYRIKHAKGLDYAEDYNDYVSARDTAFAQQLALGSLPVAMRHQIDIPEVPNGYIPEFGFGS